jgi:hypothetical protein
VPFLPYPATWWNATDYPDPADDPDREIVTVTARAGDTLTVTRGAEGTTASNKNLTGKTYKLLAGITAAMWSDLSTQNLSQSFRGLTVQNFHVSPFTHVLFNADAIVMDDGQEIREWQNVTASVGVSGVGGLDTGVETVGVCYELYAISDGGTNKAGLLHRAKDYLLDTQYATGIDGSHPLLHAAASERLAQGWKPTIAGPLEFCDLTLSRIGTPTGSIYVTLETDAGGVPSGTVLATSDLYFSHHLPSASSVNVRFPFRTPYSVSATVQYHLVLHGTYTVNASNYVAWFADTTGGLYAGGAKAAYNGTTWTQDTDDDFQFAAYISRNDVAVELPTGYTQQALICPFVFNDASGNLLQFRQVERAIHTYPQGANATSANDSFAFIHNGTGLAFVALYDLRHLTPPRPCMVTLAFGNTAAAAGAQFGHLQATWLLTNSGFPGIGAPSGTVVPFACPDGACLSPERTVFCEYQAINVVTSGVASFVRINRIDW